MTITETPLSQLMTLSDPVTTPTDPLVETFAISTPPQIVPQPLITESTTNETTFNYLNQEQTTMRTHGFKHHSLPMTELPLEFPSYEPSPQPPYPLNTLTQQSTLNSITHETPYHEHIAASHNYESELPPEVWAHMTDKQRRNFSTRSRKIKNKQKNGLNTQP